MRVAGHLTRAVPLGLLLHHQICKSWNVLLHCNGTISRGLGLYPRTATAVTKPFWERTMAKPNVHTASRDELVEAGVRAELADEILKRRRKGAIRLEALEEVPGVGPATLEQLRQVLDFREQQASIRQWRPAGRTSSGHRRTNAPAPGRAAAATSVVPARRGARTNGRGAAAATNSAARLGVKVARDTTAAGAEATAEAARSGLQVVRRSADAVGEATRRSAEGTAELGQALAELVQEQTRRNLETWTALARRSTGNGCSGSRASSCAPAWSGWPSSRGAPWRSGRR